MEETPYTRAVIRTARGNRQKMKEAIAEREKLRAEVERVRVEVAEAQSAAANLGTLWATACGKLTDSQSTVAGLRRALEEACPEEPMVQDEQGGCVWCGGYPDGRPLSMPKHKDHHKDCGWLIGRAALADTPDTFERKIQVDALEEIANLIRQTTPDGRSNSNYDRGMFHGRYRAIYQIETAVKELRGGDGMQALLKEDVANEAVAVGMGAGAAPGEAPTSDSELSIARQAAIDLAKKVVTLRTAMFEIRQHSAPSGIESGDLAIEAIAIRALEDTEAVDNAWEAHNGN